MMNNSNKSGTFIHGVQRTGLINYSNNELSFDKIAINCYVIYWEREKNV